MQGNERALAWAGAVGVAGVVACTMATTILVIAWISPPVMAYTDAALSVEASRVAFIEILLSVLMLGLALFTLAQVVRRRFFYDATRYGRMGPSVLPAFIVVTILLSAANAWMIFGAVDVVWTRGSEPVTNSGSFSRIGSCLMLMGLIWTMLSNMLFGWWWQSVRDGQSLSVRGVAAVG